MKHQLLRFKSAFIKNKEMWCVPTVLNWIFKIDLENWSVKGVCDLKIDNESYVEYIFQNENNIWCVSALGVKIIEYCIETETIKHYDLEIIQQRNRGAVFFNKKIWIIPIELPGDVICFDTQGKRFILYDKWKRECERKKVKGKTITFYHDSGIIYMTLKDKSEIICFNLKNGKLKLKKFPGQTGLRCILKVHNDFYVTPSQKRLLFQWNIETGKIEEYNCCYLSNERYVRAVRFKDNILLTDGKTIDCFEMATKRLCPYEKVPKGLKNDYEEIRLLPLFFDILRYENKWFLIPWQANMLLEYVQEDEKWEGHILQIPEKIYYEEYAVKKLKQNCIIGENEIKLSDFIEYTKNLQDIKDKDGIQELLGCQIYQHFL